MKGGGYTSAIKPEKSKSMSYVYCLERTLSEQSSNVCFEDKQLETTAHYTNHQLVHVFLLLQLTHKV